MATFLAPIANDQFFLADGTPAAGAKLFSYVANTTTKANTYQDVAGITANTNPIVLDAGGRVPFSGQVRFVGGQVYKLVLAPANDSDPPVTPYWTQDNLTGINDPGVPAGTEWVSGPIPTFISATQFSLDGDKTATFTVNRRVQTVNAGGTVYGTILSSSFGGGITTVTISPDSGVLDNGLSAVNYGLLDPTFPSAPATLLRTSGSPWRNRIINGNFEIDEYRNFAAVTLAATRYAVDRFNLTMTQASKFTVQSVASTPSPPSGLSRSLKISVASKVVAPLATDAWTLVQPIKGRNIEDFQLGTSAAVQFTLSFQAQASVAGTYAVAFLNAARNRCYVATYAVPQANVWTPIQITIPGDTAGVWAIDDTEGLSVAWDLGSGANFQTTSGSWQAGAFTTTAAATPLVQQANGSVLALTDICLELGTVALYPRERRPLSIERDLCLHYAQSLNSTGITAYIAGAGAAYSTTHAILVRYLPIKMRATPSLIQVGSVGDWSLTDNVTPTAATAISLTAASNSDTVVLDTTVAAGLTQFRPYNLVSNAVTGKMMLSAEL